MLTNLLVDLERKIQHTGGDYFKKSSGQGLIHVHIIYQVRFGGQLYQMLFLSPEKPQPQFYQCLEYEMLFLLC